MSILQVNTETCTKCGDCAAVCPGGIIAFCEDKFPRLLPRAEEMCITCGHCVAVCPSASLSHRDIPVEQCQPLDDDLVMSFEQGARLIKNRRSIREFQDKPVPREEITRIVDVARFAPTGHNEQEIRWLVVDDKDKLRQFEAIGLDWMREAVAKSPHMAEMFVGALKRMERGYKGFLRGAPVVVVVYSEKGSHMATSDSPLALGYFDLMANLVGLGCCWAGLFMGAANSFPALKEAVALPEDQEVYGALMVGYPRYRYQRIPVRNPARITWR